MRISIWYIILGVLAAMSVFSVIFSLMRGSGTPRKKLLRSVLLLGGVALLRFGGEFVLSRMGMGWRCEPWNLMLILCIVLLVIALRRCVEVLISLEKTHAAIAAFGTLSMELMMIVSVIWAAIYFPFVSWHDRLEFCDGQTIVYANDMHGGSGSHRYYAHVNGLVHGKDLRIDFMEWSDHWLHGLPLPISDPPLPRITVKLPAAYAAICAFDRQDGTELWEYTTDRVGTTRPREITEIGLIGDGYIFVCGGSVICLDARTGQERWRNDDFGGVGSGFAVGGEIIYLCGNYDGPDLFAISTEGETVKRIDNLYSSSYWPRYMDLSGDILTFIMNYGADVDPEAERLIQVNVSDWSVTLGDGNID